MRLYSSQILGGGGSYGSQAHGTVNSYTSTFTSSVVGSSLNVPSIRQYDGTDAVSESENELSPTKTFTTATPSVQTAEYCEDSLKELTDDILSHVTSSSAEGKIAAIQSTGPSDFQV